MTVWFRDLMAANQGWRGVWRLAFAVAYVVLGIAWHGPLRWLWFVLAAANLGLLEFNRRRYLRGELPGSPRR